ncbi:MAG TPA: squalene synthase HpnC [Micropepsaceae bacterium]|nr:squalene synthase HpnC [Micropepsaceae bacterium]
MTAGLFIAGLSLAIWLYLLVFRGHFWLFRERDTLAIPAGEGTDIWPSVVAVVPARNEADGIERVLGSLDAQAYAGKLRIIVVDDQSTDDTAARVRNLVSGRITLISGSPRPPGWTGKLWALSQGIAAAEADQPEFLWLTDADIIHSADNLAQLVRRADSGRFVLVSLMAKLSCESRAERLLIPAFVFFFSMLFPFSWVNRRDNPTAAAAGGCMLVRRAALVAAGGIGAIRGEIIDDCALARRLKHHGAMWLGLTRRATSVRPYATFGEIRGMVARSAFAQLHYSWALLVVTLLGLGVVYGAAPLLAIFGSGVTRGIAAAAWVCMVVAFWPISRFYGRLPISGVALPAIAGCYAAFTLDSAVQHLRGRGGMWKGRAQAMDPAADASPHTELSSGKTHRDENFPVASMLIAPQHRDIVLAFYRFVREADDVADNADAGAERKLDLLNEMRRTLLGEKDSVPSGVHLRAMLSQRRLSPQHALDLLEAFRRDVTKLRYRDWDDLVDYCSVSAMPVGRFVLDVHGESRAVWPMNDALCAALQIINHIQDCGADYRNLNRVYIPLDAFAAAGLVTDSLARNRASPALRSVFRGLVARNQALLDHAAPFADSIRDRRLALEVAVIHRLALHLNNRLLTRDPLSERVHHGRTETARLATAAVVHHLLPRSSRMKRAFAIRGRS